MRSEDEIIDAKLVPEPQPDPTGHAEPKQTTQKSLIEQVLSPYALQWMMICGGGMLMLGLVIWLWSVGIFENPIVVASVVGAATLGTLSAGVAMVRLTRYELAGRAVTLLGSIALPLNLWLYDAQGLITLADGGHLWIPAALCCFIYALVARVLRDSTFVYALVGGVVMTGMLFLADEAIGRFWTLMPPVTFLVVIGWISAFAERLFDNNDGDFSRDKFGLAFHRAGILVVTGGLALLLGGHVIEVVNWIDGRIWWPMAFSKAQEVWALGIIAASAIGFGLQSIMKQSRLYRFLTLFLIFWTVPVLLDVLSITVTVSQLAIAAALLLIAGNGHAAWIRSRSSDSDSKLARLNGNLVRTVEEFSLVATSSLVILALGQFVAQFQHPEGIAFFAPMGWTSVWQIAMAGIAACVFGWRSLPESAGKKKHAETTLFMLGIGSALITAAVTTVILVQAAVSVQVALAVALALPVMVSVAGLASKGEIQTDAVRMIVAVLMTTHLMMRVFLHLTFELSGSSIFVAASLQWSVALAIAAAVYWVVSVGRSHSFSRVMSYLSATFAVVTAGNHFGFEFEYCLVLAPMVVGTAMRLLEAFGSQGVQQQSSDGSRSWAANVLVLGSGTGGILMALSRWLSSDVTGALVLVMSLQLVCLTLTSLLTKHPTWRATFRSLIVGTIGTLICAFDGWLAIDGWQRLELCSLLGGSILLALGHMTLMRDDSKTENIASISLTLGGLLVVVPLVIGLLVYRLGLVVDANWMQFHEITSIAAALVLFGSGVLCRLRATTLSGVTLLGVYVVSLLTLVRWPAQLQSVSVMMMIGGGIFFVMALLMSIYRDRLMSLPQRVREGKGVYQILKWR